MPYKSEKIKIAGTKFDLRRKLSDAQKEAIRTLSAQNYSQRKLADIFGCSKGSIQNVLTPFDRKNKKNVEKKSNEYWAEQKRKYRQRKQVLHLQGKI